MYTSIMLVKSSAGTEFHLTYCTNVHPGETLEDVFNTLDKDVAMVRQKAGEAGSPFGVGLRLGRAAADELSQDGFAVEALGDRLRSLEGYALTVNAFVSGDFHKDSVKEDVYLPDWHDDERVEYTTMVAGALAGLPSVSSYQSMSTSPGSWKASGHNDLGRIAENIVRVATELYLLEMQFEHHIMLAVEPEPGCTFETIEEWITFYKEFLLQGTWPSLEAIKPGHREFHEHVIRRHVGTCFDCCHQAVEYEDMQDSLDRLVAEGIPIGKVQLSNALHIDTPRDNPEGVARLREFDEPRYLHQVMARRPDSSLDFFEDLPAFLLALGEDGPSWESARVHFHVPIFTRDLGPLLTTRPDLEKAVDRIVSGGLCDHLEIETYSWNVMPGHREQADETQLVRDICLEYEWALDRIRRAG